MLDSGASIHMAIEVTFLNKVIKIPPVTIGMQNGMYTMTSEQGWRPWGKDWN